MLDLKALLSKILDAINKFVTIDEQSKFESSTIGTTNRLLMPQMERLHSLSIAYLHLIKRNKLCHIAKQ